MNARRQFLRQGSLALAGLGLLPDLKAEVLVPRFVPGAPISLNANENAYGPSQRVREAMRQVCGASNRYPDETVNALKEKLAAFWNVTARNILLGAGSSELIGLACQLAARKGKHILTAEPAYKVWNRQAESFGLQIRRTELTAARTFNLPALLNAIDENTGMIYICNPNNPTGTAVDFEALRTFALAAAKKTLVFVDEAYTEYASIPSLAGTAINEPNIIVAKTYSKIYGLAGARIGYSIAATSTTEALAIMQPWADASLSLVSATAAATALDDQDFVQQCRKYAAEARSLCADQFTRLSLEYIPAVANFMLFNITPLKKDLIKEMAARNIQVQYRQHFGGNWCRVTMGTVEEMEVFCKALKEIV